MTMDYFIFPPELPCQTDLCFAPRPADLEEVFCWSAVAPWNPNSPSLSSRSKSWNWKEYFAMQTCKKQYFTCENFDNVVVKIHQDGFKSNSSFNSCPLHVKEHAYFVHVCATVLSRPVFFLHTRSFKSIEYKWSLHFLWTRFTCNKLP